MHQIPPLPDSSTAFVDDSKRPSKDFFNWLRRTRDLLNKGATETDLGTPANGSTVTIDLANGPKQKLTNNVVGFTLGPPDEIGDCVLRVINGASAGTVTFTGWHKKYANSDAFDTTSAHEFVVLIYGFGATADYWVKARQ